MNCPFCLPDDSVVVLRNELCYARRDGYPVTKGHLLIVPFRHFANYFDASEEEIKEMSLLVAEARKILVQEHQPQGFNIGINVGAAAGQTVGHVHIHLIPRYEGDMDDPRGGVRGVIPEKQKY